MNSNERCPRLPLLAVLALAFAGAPALAQEQATEPVGEEAAPADIRVTHVPEFIQQKIREELSKEMAGQVAAKIMERARMEGWGLPNVVPSWARRIKFSGDVRLRAQADLFAEDNIEGVLDGYLDYMEINRAGGRTRTDEPYLNTSEDRERMRVRARLGLEAEIAKSFDAGLRLSTGGSDPVSTNQTLGTGMSRYSVSWDQVWLRYRAGRVEAPWLTMWGGRMPNPWLSTDLVWDGDLGFEGVAATFAVGPNGMTRNDGAVRKLFLTLGAFPLQEVERASRDKWLYGSQLGFEFGRRDASRLRIGAAYYVYENITGVRNAPGTAFNDYTAPGFVQKGNLMFNIRNDASTGDPNAELWALAADYKLVNLTVEYDFVPKGDFHLILTADYVKNVGYDVDEILARANGVASRSQGVVGGSSVFEERTEGYQVRLATGYPGASIAGRWQIYGGYRYLERDAVLDAFTDSDFHLGGTDTKGWFAGMEYALRKNVWVNARWMSADSIDGAPMGVDVAQLDLNARF